MKHLFSFLLLLALTGCCKIAGPPQWPVNGMPGGESSLYRFRLERSGVTRFSGLLALKSHPGGMESVLLDASGMALLRQFVGTDGSREVAFCAAPLQETEFPEFLGKLVKYIYFTPAGDECPWYVFSCVCGDADNPDSLIKWEKFGPLHLWEVEQDETNTAKNQLTVRMPLSSLTAYMQQIENGTGN